MLRTKPLLAGVLAALILPAGASAATPTHVFKVDVKIGVGTKWTSHTQNTVCSDWHRSLDGTGHQSADMKARSLLVTLRGKRFAFPGTKTRTTLPLPGVGQVPFIALSGRVGRYAKYELTHSGKGETCRPNIVDEPPSTATCGTRDVKGGLFSLVPKGRTVQPTAMTLFDDPYDGECPAESIHALQMPETTDVVEGADAMAKLRNPRVRTVVVKGYGETKTNEPWGIGEVRKGTQESNTYWTLTFRRVR